MTWKYHLINNYRILIGSGDFLYASVQLFGEAFGGTIYFRKTGPLPEASARLSGLTQHFHGYLDYQQMERVIDLLRNEKPVWFGWWDTAPHDFQLVTGMEQTGEGEGVLAGGAP